MDMLVYEFGKDYGIYCNSVIAGVLRLLPAV